MSHVLKPWKRPRHGITILRHALDLDPTFGLATWFLAQSYLCVLQVHKAVEVMERNIRLSWVHPAVVALQSVAYGALDRPADSIAALDQLRSMSTRRRVEPCFMAYAGPNRRDSMSGRTRSNPSRWFATGCCKRSWGRRSGVVRLLVGALAATMATPAGKVIAQHHQGPSINLLAAHRIPFNEGQGGQAEPIAGASGNGMSNTFPRVSPDGRWIVFVQCRNGQLMRPDSQLYIVPAGGGQARRMRCNTSLMNSWHSFSPNGRWLVFASKSRSPYTQMYLTHIDEEGNDSPAILIENATAANRAVNLPEFVNIPPDGLVEIRVPAVDMYLKFDHASELSDKGQYEAALEEWKQLAERNPDDARIRNNLGATLVRMGRYSEAIPQYNKALELNPQYHAIQNNLGRALMMVGRTDEAIDRFRKGLEYHPESAELHDNLGVAFASEGRIDDACSEFSKALEINPDFALCHYHLGVALATSGQMDKGMPHLEKAVAINPRIAEAQKDLGRALAVMGKGEEAIVHFEKALEVNPGLVEAHLYLGIVLCNSQARTREALAHWREALRLQPNYAPAMNEAAYVLATSPEAADRNGAEAVKLA